MPGNLKTQVRMITQGRGDTVKNYLGLHGEFIRIKMEIHTAQLNRLVCITAGGINADACSRSGTQVRAIQHTIGITV